MNHKDVKKRRFHLPNPQSLHSEQHTGFGRWKGEGEKGRKIIIVSHILIGLQIIYKQQRSNDELIISPAPPLPFSPSTHDGWIIADS
jgi:hypothetical protein